MKLKKIFKGAGGRRKKKKRNRNILSGIDSIKLKRPGRVLVFETTGFELYGRIARAGLTPKYKLGEPVVSTASDFSKAVKEVRDQLKKQTRVLPKTAVLITPCAAGDLLSLPVDPKKPRPRLQMAEMVRWELEELFVKLGDMWSLGAMLQGRGYITRDQRLEVDAGSQGGPGRAPTGNDYEAFASAEQIGECLELQETLMAMDEDLATGWAPQTRGDAPFIWFGIGIGEDIRNKWAGAFKKNGLFLSFIYPRLGTALPMTTPGSEDQGWMFVDVCPEQAGLFQGSMEKLESFSVSPTDSGQADPADIARSVVRFIHPRTRDIFISCEKTLFSDVSEEIRQGTGRPDLNIILLGGSCLAEQETGSPDPEDIPGLEPIIPDPPDGADGSDDPAPLAQPVPVTAAVSMEGVARHALRRCSPHRLARIEAQDPKPPLWKNKALWPWAGILLLAAGLFANFTYMKNLADQKQWELDLADIEFNRRLNIKKEASKTASEASQLMVKLKKKQASIREQKRLKEILDNVIRYRQVEVPGVLTAIGNSVTDQVIINLIEEDADRKGFYMEAWALRDTEGQRFAQLLNKALESWSYKVANLQLAAGKGNMDLNGYNLKIKIVKDPGLNKTKNPGKGKNKGRKK